MVILEAKNIVKRFGGVTALGGSSLTCKEGRITGLLGANGSGKSTISKIITGVYLADSGEIIYNGKKVRYKNPIEAKRDGIAMAFQNLSLIPDLTVWQNIVLSFEKKKRLFLDDKAAKDLARNIMGEFLPGLDINRMVRDLDSSQMQIVEIAKAISEKPRLLILDEPTAALEQAQVKILFDSMRRLAKQGTSMIFTSHRLWEVMEICDEITVFRNGLNVGELNFDTDEKDPDKIVYMITGESGEMEFRKEYREFSEGNMLEVKNLNYGKYLKDVSFELKKGEILGIGGLQGQGQNELMLALAGNYREAAGSFLLDGKPLSLNTPNTAVRHGVLLVPGDRQKEGLMLKDSIYANFVLPKLALKRQPFFMPREKYHQEGEEIVKKLSIKTESLDTTVNNLSGGNQQKVVVGKWLPFDMKVMLLSDPAKGVDVGAKRDMYAFITNMVKEKEMSVILYASDSDELISYCDRVLIMYEGGICGELTGSGITDEAIVQTSLHLNEREAVVNA